MREDGGLGQGGDVEAEEEWIDSRNGLEVESRGLPAGLNVGVREREELKITSLFQQKDWRGGYLSGQRKM